MQFSLIMFVDFAVVLYCMKAHIVFHMVYVSVIHSQYIDFPLEASAYILRLYTHTHTHIYIYIARESCCLGPIRPSSNLYKTVQPLEGNGTRSVNSGYPKPQGLADCPFQDFAADSSVDLEKVPPNVGCRVWV